ncbi:MAG: HEPN domain-containing protein [Candidatus Aminicenantia bacterium]
MDEITKYWVEHSEYDLETAGAMLKAGRYLYVTFMCQQSIEKILKAIITTISDVTPPRIHDLKKLAKIAYIDKKMSKEQIDFCVNLTPFCFITRYAEERERLSRLANRKLAEDYFKKTKELYRWLRNLIK